MNYKVLLPNRVLEVRQKCLTLATFNENAMNILILIMKRR